MMLGVFTIVKPASQDGWLAGADAGLRRGVGGAAGRIHRPPDDRAEPAHAAAHPGCPQDRGGNLIQVLIVAGMFGMFFLGALYLRLVLGYSPLRIGLAFLPVASVMGTLSVRYTDRLPRGSARGAS